MMLVIQTQDQENYGAHDWDGKGACPQYWKFKGGQEIKVTGVDIGMDMGEIIEMIRADIERDDDYFRTTIVSYGMEADSYLSWFEKSQLDYEGSIAFCEPTIAYADLVARLEDPKEYAERAADADAVYYGA
jgi:hypothetical protein